MSATLSLFDEAAVWSVCGRGDPRGRALADRHYSRQTPGAVGWAPPGEHLSLIRDGALWTVVRNLDPRGRHRWRVTLFRRESGPRASDLVRTATEITFAHWRRRGGGSLPPEALTTEVDAVRVASSNPGFCFRAAGWRRLGERRGLIIFVAPGEIERGATLPLVSIQ